MVEKGVIIKGIGGFYYIRTESGKLIESKAKGIFRKWKITPLVGDTVDISYDGEGENGSVSKIYDRSNPFANRTDCAECGLRERGNRGDFHE